MIKNILGARRGPLDPLLGHTEQIVHKRRVVIGKNQLKDPHPIWWFTFPCPQPMNGARHSRIYVGGWGDQRLQWMYISSSVKNNNICHSNIKKIIAFLTRNVFFSFRGRNIQVWKSRLYQHNCRNIWSQWIGPTNWLPTSHNQHWTGNTFSGVYPIVKQGVKSFIFQDSTKKNSQWKH